MADPESEKKSDPDPDQGEKKPGSETLVIPLILQYTVTYTVR